MFYKVISYLILLTNEVNRLWIMVPNLYMRHWTSWWHLPKDTQLINNRARTGNWTFWSLVCSLHPTPPHCPTQNPHDWQTEATELAVSWILLQFAPWLINLWISCFNAAVYDHPNFLFSRQMPWLQCKHALQDLWRQGLGTCNLVKTHQVILMLKWLLPDAKY